MGVFILICACIYVLLITTLLLGWRNIPYFKNTSQTPKIDFSVIIPFRNEAENLPVLLQSILEIDYPSSHFEVILVDDFSEDASVKIIEEFQSNYQKVQISILENKSFSNSPKKDALTLGIKKAQFEYIITTDGDCKVPKKWLHLFNQFIVEHDPHFIAAPVRFMNENVGFNKSFKKYLIAFQHMDILSLQLTGAGGFGMHQPFMCNGANICYKKSTFLEIGAFTGNEHISSGDDVFLLQKLVKMGFKVGFLKNNNAVVETKAQEHLTDLISQRIRWASKTPAYTNLFPKFLGIIVLLLNVFLIVGLILIFLDLLFYQNILFAFLLKFLIDFAVLYESAVFFKKKNMLRHYFWISIIYPFFTSYVAVLSLFKKTEWKGRKLAS